MKYYKKKLLVRKKSSCIDNRLVSIIYFLQEADSLNTRFELEKQLFINSREVVQEQIPERKFRNFSMAWSILTLYRLSGFVGKENQRSNLSSPMAPWIIAMLADCAQKRLIVVRC